MVCFDGWAVHNIIDNRTGSVMNEESSVPALLKTDSKRSQRHDPSPPGSYILQSEIKTTKDAIKEITQQIPLLPKRTLIPQAHQIPLLITGNNRSRSNNQTIKRSSPQGLPIRTNEQLEQTKDEIRIKIILENSRLKNSIENLRQDIDYYQDNQKKIVEILRESKNKLADYKEKLKEKSRRVTEVTDKNIALKGQMAQLQLKISNMTSYSEWQERQIQELKMDITAQAAASNHKISQLQVLLKTYEQGIAETGAGSHHFIQYINSSPQQALSSGTISEGTTPYSIKEMEMRDIESIKYRNADQQEMRQLRQDNLHLKARIRDLQAEIQQLKSESELRERSVVEDQEDLRRRQTTMREEMDNMIERSLSMSQQLSEKASSIQNLERELMEIREYIKAAQQKYVASEESYRAEIYRLTTENQQKNIQIQRLLDNIKEIEEYYARYGEQIKESMEAQSNLHQVQSLKISEEVKRLQQELDKYETEIVRLSSLNQKLQQSKEQNKQKIYQASIFLQQREEYEQICAELKAKVQYYQPLSQKNIEYFHSELAQANQRCIDLERQKQELTELMERYAAEIRELKNDVAELNRQKNDSLGSHEELPEVREETYEEIVQLRSETSLMNPIDIRNSLKQAEQMAPMFDSHPLQEQDELQQESGEEGEVGKDALIEQLRQQLQELRISYDELREEVKKYTTEVVEANVNLDKDREKQKHLNSQITSMQYDIYAKDMQIQEKEEHIATLLKKITEQEAQLNATKGIIQQMNQEIDRQISRIVTLEQNLQEQKQTNQDLGVQMVKFSLVKDELQLSLKKIQQEIDIEHATRNELQSSLQLELNRQKQMEDELMNSRRLAESAQIQQQNGKARAQQLETEVQRCRNAQKDLQEKIKTLNAEKSRLHEEVIARMTENDTFHEQYSRLQAEIQELRHYRKEELDQIESLKKSTCEIQVIQTSLQGEREQLIKKISLQSDQISAKAAQIQNLTQRLNKANLKITSLQQFQKQMKPQIDKNLTILSDIINQQKKQIQKLTVEKLQLISQRQAQSHSMTELKSEKKKSEQVVGDLEKQLQTEARSNADLKGQISNLHDEFDEHIQENNRLKDKVVGCEEEIRRLKLQLDSLHREKELLVKVNEDIKGKLEVSQKTIKQFSINIAGLKESFELSRSSVGEHNLHDKSNEQSLSIKLEEEPSKMGISNLKLQISHIQNRHRSVVEDYQHRIRSTSVKVQEITKEKQGKIAQLQANLNSLRQQISDANMTRDSLQATVKQLNKAIADNHVNIERLQGQLTESREILSSKDVVISSLQRNIAIIRVQMDEKDKVILDLQGKLETSRNECKALRANQGILQGRINQFTRQHEIMKSTLQSEIVKLGDNLQISRKMLQEAEEDHQLKANKLNKQITGYKFMLEENQKENSFQLEQSNRSITEIKNEVKVYLDTIKQKDTEIKESKEAINQVKQSLQNLKLTSSRFEEQKAQWDQQRTQLYQKQDQLQEEIRASKNEINSLRANMNQQSNDFQKIQSELNSHKSTIQHLQNSQDVVTKEKAMLQAKIQKMIEEKSRIQSKLQSTSLERNDYQLQCEELQQQNRRLLKRNMEESQSMQISAINLVSERKELQYRNSMLQTQNQALRQQIKRLQKQHQTRMQDLCLQQRQNLLDVQHKHEEQIHQHIQQIQECMITIQDLKEKDQAYQQERENLSNRLKINEKSLKDAENEIGELTDKILHLTQENNELNAIIEDLRNSVVDKGNQIEQCRDAISKLQEELEEMRAQRSPINSSGSIPLSIETEQKLNEAYEFIERLTEANKELELQLKDKARVEKDLNEKLQRQKERENRERHSSCDSFPTKSKIFDEKSQNLVTEIEEVKMRLTEAEAYIQLLQEEKQHEPSNNKDPNREDAGHEADLHQRVIQLEKQVQNLRMLNEQQQAYIGQLQNGSNLASSIRSRRSAIPSQAGRHKQHSKIEGAQSRNSINEKIYLLINFIDSYSRDSKSRQKQQELKAQLTHPVLQELLSTIFYRLQKQSGIIKDNERALVDLQDQIQTVLQNYTVQKKNKDYLMKQNATLEINFKEAEKSCEELITEKMNLEADVAECRSYIQELQNKLARYERGKEESKKEGLQILEQEHESSSDSMMSESADSEMPSSVHQSKEFRSSMDIRGGKGKMSMSKSIMRTKSNNFGEDKGTNADFLKKCLMSIKELQGEVERIEAQLVQKNRMLNLFVGEIASKQELISKLSMIESKLKINDREIKNHFETSQMQVAALIKDLLRYRQQKDQYGLQNQSRKKIDEYLNLLQQQLVKNSKMYEQEGKMQEASRKGDSPLRMGGSLHQIKQDAVNEDKGSSIVSPRNGQVLRSFSNSEGVSESLDIYQIKHNYNQAIRELHELHEELANKQDLIKNTQRNYRIMQQDVSMMLDDIRMSFEEDQYIIDQIEKIKKYMGRHLQEESHSFRMKDSQEKIEEEKVNILVESNQKNMNNLSSSKNNENPFQKLLKMNESALNELAESVSNEKLKELHRRIEQIMNQRFDDCLDFLNTDKSLIADILKIRNDEAYLQSTMNKLASKLTKQEIQEIITNSNNRMEANKTLSLIIRDEDAKSMVSDEHDFSPNGDKIRQIRNRVYSRPTELSISMQNQLLEILAAPTRHHFYELIEEYYKILKDFEDKFQAELSEKDERSEKHSIRIKRVLQGPRQNLQYSQDLDGHLQVSKPHKNRSSSYNLNIPQN